MKQLRPLQQNGYDGLRRSLATGHMRPLLQGATGFGKTVVSSHIISSALGRGKRAMFVVPSITLVDQTARAFYDQGITDIGIIQANHPLTDPKKPVQIASAHTLIRRKSSHIPHSDIVLIDEAHMMFDGIGKLMNEWNNIPFIGLSATPWARGMGLVYDDLIIAATTQQLIDDGLLCPFRVYAPSHPDLTGVKSRAGDFVEEELSKVMRGAQLVADVVSEWKKRASDRPTLCFGVDRLHAKALQAHFEESGVRCGYIDAYTSREERKEQQDMLVRGELKVISNVSCLTTGVDIPEVSCLILARPTRSEILYTQIVGRGLRMHDSKDYLLILDHSDTTLRLGFVTDIHHEELSTKDRLESNERSEERKPVECKQCGFLKPPRTPICPACNYQAPERQDKTQTADGELVELNGMSAAKRKLNREWGSDRKAEFMAALKTHCVEKGYKPGWAANQYREKFGVWPNKYSDVPPGPKNDDFKKWMAHRAIKSSHYYKRRA